MPWVTRKQLEKYEYQNTQSSKDYPEAQKNYEKIARVLLSTDAYREYSTGYGFDGVSFLADVDTISKTTLDFDRLDEAYERLGL